MAKKNYSAQGEEKSALGKLISDLRSEKGFTLRKFADAVGLSPSNVTYIEKGINAPTAEIYQKIFYVLIPNNEQQKELDRLYSSIRKIPPPDVCNMLIQNPSVAEKIRMLGNIQLSSNQLKKMEELFISFKKTMENDNDE